MSVQLAPQHKEGLALPWPLLVANCTAELLGLLDRAHLGAVIAPEIGGRRRRPRQIVERPGGFLLAEGRGAFSLSGLRRLLRAAGGLAVIGRLPALEPHGAARAAARLADEGVSAIELDLLPGDPELAYRALDAVRAATGLPLLAGVPLVEAVPCALIAEEAEADALIVATPPRGLAASGDPAAVRAVEVHGPLLHPLTLLAVQQVAAAVTLPIVARGGLLTVDDARSYLAQGAAAIAADSLATVDPGAIAAIGRGLTQV